MELGPAPFYIFELGTKAIALEIGATNSASRHELVAEGSGRQPATSVFDKSVRLLVANGPTND